jgi:uncharacterized protein
MPEGATSTRDRRKTGRDLVGRVRRRVRRLMAKESGSHGYDHVRRVLALSLRFGREAGADLEVLSLSALLHDIGRPEETRSNGNSCHARIGSEMAEEILKGYGAAPALVESVTDSIRRHRFRGGSPPQSLEAKILYDADKLDSLGAVGIGRAFLFAGEVGARLHNTAAAALKGRSYTSEDTAYREYLVKLRKLPVRMRTPFGRRLARERAVYMEDFFRRLTEETKGVV